MSEVRLNILDARRTLHGMIRGTEIDWVIASLSACPTTIEELQKAVPRFAKPEGGIKPFGSFDPGINEHPCDAGIAFIDLEARVAATEATYANPQTNGTVFYHDGVKLTNIGIQYYVPDDWLLLNSIREYKCIRDIRKLQRSSLPPLDVRAVLYGAVAEYIVEECFAARKTKESDPIASIHARWLMTPRDDLRGQSPRMAMLQQREFIDADLQSRELQWSLLREPPPCLDTESHAYRFAGFGTHEVIVYYDLVRFLISKCWKHVKIKRPVPIPDELARLKRLQSDWLQRPRGDYEGKSAVYIAECERKRLPLAVPAEEAIFDDDCPLCRAMAGHSGPVFCHFDGSQMEDDFPFSLCLTYEEWEEERYLRHEFRKDLEKKWDQQDKKLSDGAVRRINDSTTIH